MSNWAESESLNQESVSSPRLHATSGTASPALNPATSSKPVSASASPALKPTSTSYPYSPQPSSKPSSKPNSKPPSALNSPRLGPLSEGHQGGHHFHIPKIHSPFSSPKLKPVADAFDTVLGALAPEIQTEKTSSTHKKTSYTAVPRVH